MNRIDYRALMGCALLLAGSGALAQDRPAPLPPAPAAASANASDILHRDPAAFLDDAAKFNGLNGPYLPEWHLKVSFSLVDDKGQVTDNGVFEQYRASPTKYRINLTTRGHALAIYATGRPDQAVFRSGEQNPTDWPVWELEPAYVHPLPQRSALASFDLEPYDIALNGVTAACIRVNSKPMVLPGATGGQVKPAKYMMGSYCFEPGTVNLTASFPMPTSGALVLRSHPTRFEGHWIPSDLAVAKGGKVALTAHLVLIEALTQIDEALFVPPADAKLYPTMMLPQSSFGVAGIAGLAAPTSHEIKIASDKDAPPTGGFGVAGMEGLGGPASGIGPAAKAGATQRVNIPAGVAVGMLLEKTQPVYPPVAKAARVQGTVVLEATISKTGTIEDLRVVSGPPMLQGAAIDAVKTWRYKPYLLMDKPVEVLTTVNVIFVLGEAAPASH